MSGDNVEFINDILSNESSLASAVGGTWSRWDTDWTAWIQRAADVTKYVFAESTRTTENGANFENSTHRPKITQIYDNLVANYVSGLMPHKNWFKIVAESKEDFENTKKRQAITAYLVTKHRIKKLTTTVWKLVDDWVLYGNAFAMVYYSAEGTNKENKKSQNSLNYAGPVVKRISPYDIRFNVSASSFDKSAKIIRSLKTMGDLIREAEDNPEDGWKLEVVDLMRDQRKSLAGVTPEHINKATQRQVDGFGTYADYIQSDVVEILELYGDIYDTTAGELHRDQVITVADRRHVIRQKALDTWNGRPRLVHSGWRDRKDNLMAMGPLDNIVGMQYRINHLENAQADAMDDMIYGDIIISGAVETEENPDGSKTYILADGGGISRLAPDTTILSADLKINELESKMELYAGSPREAAGFRTPGEKTKFEFSSLMQAASRIFQHKLSKFEREMMEPILNFEIEVSHDNLTTAEAVRFENEEQGLSEFLKVTKQDLSINGRIVPIGARHYAREQQVASDLKDFMTQVLANDEELRNHFPSQKLAKLFERVFDFEEYEILEVNGRVAERVDLARAEQAAQTIVQGEIGADDTVDEEGIVV